MADTKTARDGVYFDTKNRKVVHSVPEEGIQIVAPGGEITAEAQRDIDRYTDIENGVESDPGVVSTGDMQSGVAEAVEKAADTATAKGRKG